MSMLNLRPVVNPRREMLLSAPNPARRLDYVVTIASRLKLDPPFGDVRVTLRYVPDMLVLDQAAITGYMHELGIVHWDNLESLARVILDDFSNELIARWIEVTLSKSPSELGAGAVSAFDYMVVMEDRQPTWSNPELLAHLRPAV